MSAAAALSEGSVRARTDAVLQAARARPDIFWALDGDRAMADAAALDRAGPDADRRLAGIPIAVKDNFHVRDLPIRLGLPAPLNVPEDDAWAVSRLRAHGAIVIGTTAMDQLAYTMTGQAPGYPSLENPAAPGHLCGGSSGGSAAAVAAEIVPVALGTDTAGSVRVPAAWCGVVGVKPTLGAIALTGVAPLAPTLDGAGVLGRTVADCVDALAALGIDADPPAAEPIACAVLGGEVPGWFAEVAEGLADAAAWPIRARPTALPTPRIGRIIASELARCWPAVREVTEEIAAGRTRGRGLDPDDVARDRASLQMARAEAPGQLLGSARLLLTPTVPGPAPRIGDTSSVAEASRYTRALAALGWPCATLPCGRVHGRPVGVQLAAAPGEDGLLLACLRRAEALLDAEASRA